MGKIIENNDMTTNRYRVEHGTVLHILGLTKNNITAEINSGIHYVKLVLL